MKRIKLLPIVGIFLAGFPLFSTAQEQILPEVTVAARNYKYLRAVGGSENAQPVRLLERQAATYNIKNSEYYEEEYDNYHISFYLPDGYILALYDSAGNIMQTAERFKNISLPKAITKAIGERFPNWRISNDIYQVNYENTNGGQKVYKIVLTNGDKRMRVKMNDKGEFL